MATGRTGSDESIRTGVRSVTEPGQKPRRSRRRKAGVNASCESGDGRTIGVAVTDISEDGCRLESRSEAFAPDQDIVVRPQGLEALAGRVRWTHDKAAGVEFASKLHPALVEHASGEAALEGLPPMGRPRGSGLTDNFGRPLPALGSARRR